MLRACVCLGSYGEDAGFAKNTKPCCSSLSTMNNNNSKLAARTEMFSVNVMSVEGPKFIRNRWGRWCEFNKQQTESERDVGM